MKIVITLFCCFMLGLANAQSSYKDSMKIFLDNYVVTHEVVTGDDKGYFRFFPADRRYRVTAKFEKLVDETGFDLQTSGTKTKHFYKYGRLLFKLRDTALTLYVYQSRDLAKKPEFANYLFLPFTDNTTGDQSYGSGRYIDLQTTDIVNSQYSIDFNKAYNPYCAYTTGFNCPIPPKENFLNISIEAGEKTFAKPVH